MSTPNNDDHDSEDHIEDPEQIVQSRRSRTHWSRDVLIRDAMKQ